MTAQTDINYNGYVMFVKTEYGSAIPELLKENVTESLKGGFTLVT